VTVTVVAASEDTHTEKVICDALFLLVSEANNCFYEMNFVQDGYSGEQRKKWEMSEELHACGSTNYRVIAELYIFLNQYLQSIQKELQGIRSVTIITTKHIIQVRPAEISSD
jgi:hypothetical protein